MWRSAWVLLATLAAACAASAIELRLIGVATLLRPAVFAGTIVGGLSGLDYDAANDRWLAVSDDRSREAPARFYTVAIDYDEQRVRAARVTAVTKLHGFAAGDAREPRDFEALRIDPREGSVWLASEGDAALHHVSRDGQFLTVKRLPAGARPNRSFESLTFTPDGASLWLGLEAPFEHAAAPPTATNGARTSIIRLTRDGAECERAFYQLDAWQRAPAPGMLADNGLSELLTLPDGRLLALERSGAQDAAGAWRFSARLHLADLARGTKRLVFDFARGGHAPVGNLEGLAWGRWLANGHGTLVVVSDNNFSDAADTQFWVFEVLGDAGVGRVSDLPTKILHAPGQVTDLPYLNPRTIKPAPL